MKKFVINTVAALSVIAYVFVINQANANEIEWKLDGAQYVQTGDQQSTDQGVSVSLSIDF